jgi:trigger factor
MTATVETLDGLNRRLTLNLNAAAIETEVGKRLAQVARNVRFDGFRPGKAPRAMVAARYGGEIRGEVMGEALQRAFNSAIDELKLPVAGYPRFEAAEGGAFTATFEVFPEIEPGDVSQVKVNRPVVEVGDADVDRTLEVLKKQRVQYHAVERASQNGDRVHVDYEGRVDGEAFPGGAAKDFPVILGEGRTLPEFEGALTGMAAGDKKTFDVSFPADYFAKEMAGKTATFEAELKSVHEPRFPEMDDEFAASLGVNEGGVAKLREEVAGNLKREAKRRIAARVKEQVLNALLANAQFDVPQSMVAMERQALLQKAVNDLKQRGLKEADIKLTEEIFDSQAKRRVALGLLMDALVRANDIKIGEEQVRALVDEFAQSYEDPSEVVAWYYQDQSRLNEARTLVLEENLVNWVLERAQVTDETITLEQLMGNN